MRRAEHGDSCSLTLHSVVHNSATHSVVLLVSLYNLVLPIAGSVGGIGLLSNPAHIVHAKRAYLNHHY